MKVTFSKTRKRDRITFTGDCAGIMFSHLMEDAALLVAAAGDPSFPATKHAKQVLESRRKMTQENLNP
jgi:hypothetical protein